MSRHEDRTIIFRNIQHRLSETILLIIGLALGIGASAAGIALVIRSVQVSQELINSPQYREITVSTRQSTNEMDMPIMIINQDQSVILTSIDLQAASDSPDIAYGYIKQPNTFRSTASFLENSTGIPRGQGGGGGLRSEALLGSGIPGNTMIKGIEAPSTLPEPLDDPEPALTQWSGYLVTPEFFTAWGLQAKTGSLFTVEDASLTSTVMVLGSNLAEILYEDKTALGKRFISGPTVYEIIGILEPTGTYFDDMAYSPAFMPDMIQNIQLPNASMLQSRWNSSLNFMVHDPSALENAAEQLEQYFTRTYGPGSTVITIQRHEAQAVQDRNTRIITMILFLALAGLFIAGVNVSNILLGRALRKQKIIGVLKALGASKRRIFSLFFREALMIGILAAIVGVGISYILAELMQRTAQLGSINVSMLAVGIVIAWVITAILTIFPALQASKIPAAEAMRIE